jgi:hypothetical protein
MRKNPIEAHKIELWKDVYSVFLGELEEEERKLDKWEQDKIQMALWRMRPIPGFFDRSVTSRHQLQISLRKQGLKKVNKLLRCGALTRSGKPCQCKPEEGKRRCRYHGGRSTGPKTQVGRDAIRESNRRRAQVRKSSEAEAGRASAQPEET